MKVITQDDYNIINQQTTERYIKLNILDFQYNVVDEISGNMTNCSVQCDANSDLRRSCNATLVVTDNSFDIQAGGKIFLDKMIQLYIGLKNLYTQEIQWYNQGIYLIDAPNWQFDAMTNTLSFTGLDLMSKLTGARNGQLEGIPTVIKQGESVRSAMIDTLKLGGFTKYLVSECQLEDGTIQAVPYDIEIDQGGYVFDILSALRDILPQYQIYFDVDGVFHYEQILHGDNDPIILDDSTLGNILISENISTDFASVKNYVEVYGRTHNPDYYPSTISVSSDGQTISLAIAEMQEAVEYNQIGFTLPKVANGDIVINVNDGMVEGNLVDSAGLSIEHLDADVYYVAQWQEDGTWLFLGGQQAFATWSDKNPDSPFYINGPVGMIREVLYGGDYDNIISDELALQRAKLEIYWKCRLNDSITIEVVPIPWLDVNILMSHAIKNKESQDTYMIQSFSANYGDVSSTMSITASKYYPYYPAY